MQLLIGYQPIVSLLLRLGLVLTEQKQLFAHQMPQKEQISYIQLEQQKKRTRRIMMQFIYAIQRSACKGKETSLLKKCLVQKSLFCHVSTHSSNILLVDIQIWMNFLHADMTKKEASEQETFLETTLDTRTFLVCHKFTSISTPVS